MRFDRTLPAFVVASLTWIGGSAVAQVAPTPATLETETETTPAETTPAEPTEQDTDAPQRFVPATVNTTVTSQGTAPAGDTGDGVTGTNTSPGNVDYLWDYAGLTADWANFRHSAVGARLNLGPHSAVSATAVYNFVSPGLAHAHAELGVGGLTGEDGEVIPGPAMHGQLYVGFPLTDWRGHGTTTMQTGTNETGPRTLTIGVPTHRRLIFEAGVSTTNVNMDGHMRNTSPGFGVRWLVDWNFVSGDSHTRRHRGMWWLAAHAVPTTWAGRGGEVGGGFDVDLTIPVSKSRSEPTLFNVGGAFLPDGSWTAQAGVTFMFARF